MYLITGATGNVGSAIVEQLLAAGEQVRVFTRNEDKVTRWKGRVEVAVGGFEQTEVFEKAAAGVKGVFLMNGALDQGVFEQLISAAERQGIQRVVFLSSLLASNPELAIGKLHKQKEDALHSSGLSGAVLRAGNFMSNALQWAGTIKAEGVIYNALGTGKTAPIAPEDIARVAVKELRSPAPGVRVYELTGDVLLTVPEQAKVLSQVLARPINVVEVPIEAAVQGMVRNGIPEQLASAVSKSFEAIREGRAERLTETVAEVTGSRPTSFELWARKHASQFA